MANNLALLRVAVQAQQAQQRHVNHNLTNQDRRAAGYHSGIARFLRRNKTAEAATDPKAIWKFEYQRNVTRLSFLILIYLYTQDDDIISAKEERSIKKILKLKSSYLKPSDYTDITKFVDSLPDLSYVMSYINDNNIKDKVFNESITTVKTLIVQDRQYYKILRDLENQYK